MYAQIEKPRRFENETVIDINADKKLKLCIYLAAAAAAMLLAAIGNLAVPITALFDTSGILQLVMRALLIAAAAILYYWLHEYIHACVEKRTTGLKPKIKLHKLSAYCESKCYYSVRGFNVYTFAPVVILGAVLLVLMLAVPAKLFWQVYIIQIINIAGAAGDIFTAFKLKDIKQETVIKDNGATVSYWTK